MVKILFIPLFLSLFNSTSPEEEKQHIEFDSLQHLQLQEVNVVATIKENGQLRQQPASVSSLGKQNIADNHITSLKGTSSLVPNMFIPDYGSRLTSAIYIRGIGSRINTPAVGLYVDNIPYIDKSAFDFNFYDVERIDVLRGPQGTLYGRNTMGGLVRIYTRNPMHYEGTDMHFGFATKDLHRNISLTHYHRVNETIAFSAGGYYEGSNGFFTNNFTGEKIDQMQSAGGRMRGIYKPKEQLTFDITIGYDYSDEGAYPYFYTGTLSGDEEYESNIGKITNNRESRYRRGMANAGLNIEYKADNWQLNAITGYQNINDRMFMDQDFISSDIYTLEQKQKINTITEEVTIKNTDRGKWEWLSGINLMYQSLHTDGPVNFYSDGLRWLENNINTSMPSIDNIMMLKAMGFTGMSVNFRGEQLLMSGSYDTPTLGAALFHQSTYHLTDKFSASVGIRFDYEQQKMDYYSPAHVEYGFRMPNTSNSKMAVDLQDLVSDIEYKGCKSNSYFKVLPKFAIKYDFDNRNNIYATAAMGQRSGGYNLQMFSDLLQGSLRVDMMNGIKQGVGNYLDYLVRTNSNIPTVIPDPDAPGTMVGLPEYVRRVMGENMPQFEVPTTEQVIYKPEYSWNYELGTHLTQFENKINIDAAIFYNRIYNQQIARFAPTGLGRMMVNAGKSQSYGGEIAIRYTPSKKISINCNYGYTHATFLEHEDGQGNDYKGKYVPYVPMHNMNVDATYTWYLRKENSCNNNWFAINKISLGANCYGAGKIYWTESNKVAQNFYTQIGTRLSMDTEKMTIMLWGKNLLNSTYNTFYFESASRGFEQHCKPIQLGIDINIKL